MDPIEFDLQIIWRPRFLWKPRIVLALSRYLIIVWYQRKLFPVRIVYGKAYTAPVGEATMSRGNWFCKAPHQVCGIVIVIRSVLRLNASEVRAMGS